MTCVHYDAYTSYAKVLRDGIAGFDFALSPSQSADAA